jgi:hypothetical protein
MNQTLATLGQQNSRDQRDNKCRHCRHDRPYRERQGRRQEGRHGETVSPWFAATARPNAPGRRRTIRNAVTRVNCLAGAFANDVRLEGDGAEHHAAHRHATSD